MDEVKDEIQNIRLFEKVCMIYSRELQRFIYRLTRNDSFAMEEIYQNAMLEALKGLRRLRDSSKMKSWIFSIAKAEAKRYYAASRLENLWGCFGAAAEKSPAGAEWGTDFTKSVEEKEYVKALINGLSEKEQRLYILHYYHDLPLKAISGILNVNYSTVRSIHMRGMAKMRKQLKRLAE